MSCFYGGDIAENYRQGYRDAEKKYEGVTIQGLQVAMDVMAQRISIDEQVIAEANNSLYGSQGYFLKLSPDSTIPEKYHLASGIENLKEQSRKQYREIEKLKKRIEELEEFEELWVSEDNG